MKLTRKGYLVLSVFILVMLLGGFIFAYVKSPVVRAWVAQLKRTQAEAASTQAPAQPAQSANTPATTTGSADAEIRASLLQQILKNPDWRKHAIEVDVNQGTVTLRGAVENEAQRVAIEQYARGLAGVKDLNSVLVIKTETPEKPAENPDERLAKEVEFACYKSDAFDVKRMEITAANGVVRLGGRVRSRAEKLLAERIAREVAGVKSVTNLLEISDEE